MMIIVVGDKDGQIDQPHGRPQARMERCLLEHCGIRCNKKLYELTAQIAKLSEEIVHATAIVIGFVRTTVSQLGGFQLGFTRKDLFSTPQPQRFEDDKMAHVFLH